MRIGLVGAGDMGSGLAANWRAGGNQVLTCLEGRSDRTRGLALAAGLESVPTIDEVVVSDVVVSIVPPAAAVGVAKEIAAATRRRGSDPLVVDLNAIAPATVERVRAELGGEVDSFVDGSISGLPPRPGTGRTTVYLSGPRAEEVAAIASPWAEVVVLGDRIGTASALKMCTSSMYKGTNALVIQALLTASHFGVLEPFLADVSTAWPESVSRWAYHVALAAAKSERFTDEMHEISTAQSQAGAVPALFESIAAVFEHVTAAQLGQVTPESIDPAIGLADVIEGLR